MRAVCSSSSTQQYSLEYHACTTSCGNNLEYLYNIQAKIQTYLEQIFQELEAQLCPEEETWHEAVHEVQENH
jgi:hypothetical protein